MYIQINNLNVLKTLPTFWWLSSTHRIQITQQNKTDYYLPYTTESVAALKAEYLKRSDDAYINALSTVKKLEIDNAYERAMLSIKEGYTPTEIETWFKQTSEVEAWLADNSAPTPMLDHLLPVGIAKVDFVAVIKQKSDAYAVACGDLLKHKRELHADVDVAAASSLTLDEKATQIIGVLWGV